MTNQTKISKFTIFSERNSGSNYLRDLITANLGLKYTTDYGFKHWWMKNVPDRPELNETTDKEIKHAWNDQLPDGSLISSDVLFIILVRNPFEWLKSMYLRPHHLKEELKSSYQTFEEFLKIPWICEEKQKLNNLWIDNESYFIEKTSNIIELRNAKYRHWLNLLDNGPKHIELIQYEDLPEIIDVLAKKYQLPFTTFQDFSKSQALTNSINKRPNVSKELYDSILQYLDIGLEEKLGYDYSSEKKPLNVLQDNFEIEVMSMLGQTDFDEYVIVNDHISLNDWQMRLKDILSQFHEKVTCWYTYRDANKKWQQNTLYFLFNVHAQHTMITWPTHFVHIQTEVYPTPHFDNLIMRQSLLRAQETWDYSLANVKKIKEDMGRSNYYHVPFPLLHNPESTVESKRDIDILFIGTLCTWLSNPDIGLRRKPIVTKICNYFEQQNKVVKIVEAGCVGEDQLKLFRNTKIVLNIHYYYDIQPLEQARIIPALECGAVVVSEQVPTEEQDIVISNKLIYCDQHDMIERIEQLLFSEKQNIYNQDNQDIIVQNPTTLESLQQLKNASSVGSKNLPLLGLHMIVRDEEHNLRLNIPKLQSLIDVFVFVDTGSQDGTIEYLRSFCRCLPNNKKGYIVQRKWIDEFDQSRNESLRLCRGRVQYALTLDADDILFYSNRYVVQDLLRDSPIHCFTLFMKDRGCTYLRRSIVSMKKSFIYQYKCHEIIGPTFFNAAFTNVSTSVMYIERGKLRGYRSQDPQRLLKDIKILKRCYKIESDEDRPRYCFYLAKSYFEIQNWKKAQKYYLLRSVMGSYHEEVYYSVYQSAMCSFHLKKPLHIVIRQLKLAIQDYPARIDTIWSAIYLLRKENKFQEAFELGKTGLEKPWNNEFQFAVKDVYLFRLIDEVATCSNFCQEHAFGHLLLLGLLRAVPISRLGSIDAKRIVANFTGLKKFKPTLAVYTGYTLLFAKDSKHFGGSEIILLEVLPLLQQVGFEIHLFTIDELQDRQNNKLTSIGIHCHHVSEIGQIVEQQPHQRFNTLIVHRYVHYFLHSKPSWAAQTYVWLHDNMFQPYWNGHPLPGNGQYLIESVSSEIHSVVTSSLWHKRVIATQYPSIIPKLKVIPLGIPQCTNILGVKRIPWKFVWVSDPSRGFEKFVQIFMKFKQNICSQATLDIYGNASKRELLPEPFRYKDGTGITFHGYVKDRNVLMNSLWEGDIFLYPLSLGTISHETFCLSVVEAMRTGMLVICPARAALSELITNERGLLLKQNADENDYYETLVNVFHNYEKYEAIRTNAVQFAKKYTFQACADEWLKLLTRSEHLYHID